MVQKIRHHQGLALVLLLHLILAIAYSIVVPIGRGADEWAHYWYTQFIVQNGRLPANPVEREAAGYKSDWPPLYHLFAAGLTTRVDTNGPPTFKYRPDNTCACVEGANIRRQLVSASGPEAILHTEDELFPWQQEILVWHLGRFLSIAFATGTLWLTYLIALEVFSSNQVASSEYQISNTRRARSPKVLALISVAALAFIPRFLFTGMLFNYDSLTLLIASLFLWFAIRVAKGYHPRWGFWGLGALAGLALVTKYLTALLPLEILVLAFFTGIREQRRDATEVQGSRHITHHTPEGTGVSRITYHASRITYHVSRITYHVSRITRSVAVRLGQAALAYLFITSWWFSYLLINFNEVDTYGPVLGTLAPLIRGDASDRTVEEIFAWLSGGQALPPAYIEKQSYTAWQIMAALPTTFWGNPITKPYSLNWFVWTMTVVAMIALVGLILVWRNHPPQRRWVNLLILHCASPVPFMLIRLFGARDALEAVQGRHILFLAGPAVAVLLVWGLRTMVSGIKCQVSSVTYHVSRITYHVSRITYHALLALLLIGSISQLIFMWQAYPPLLPIRTTPYSIAQAGSVLPRPISLPGGASLIDFSFSDENKQVLQVNLIWQGGDSYAPEDYQMELALVDSQGQTQFGWWAYQTQAYYPTRVWEPGDVIRDEGWLPLAGLAAGEYEIRLRLIGKEGTVVDWQTLGTYVLDEPISQRTQETEWVLWRNGSIAHRPPMFRERETAQFTISNLQSPISNTQKAGTGLQSPISNLQLLGPDGVLRSPISTGAHWANFIIKPDWPAGDYYAAETNHNSPLLRVAESERNFQIPAISSPLEANFAGKIKLLGYDLPSRLVEPGDGLPLTLYWQGLQWMGEEFVIFDRLLDNQQVVWGGYDRLPQENYSTLLWAPGEVVLDGFAVPVQSDAPDGVYSLNVGWYQEVEGQANSLVILNPETGEPAEETAVTIGPIKVGGPPAGVTVNQATPRTEVNVPLGAKIKLLGFDLAGWTDQESVAPEDLPILSPLELTFYWQALAAIDTDYTVFVHVRNAAGEIVSQKDSPPVAGVYPTSLWDAGEIIEDDFSVPLAQLEPGRYDIVVGMYDFATGERLMVDGSPDGTILLQSFEVLAE